MSSSTDSHIALPRFANRPPVYQKDMRDERISGAKNEIYNHTPYGGYVESIKQKRVVSLCQKSTVHYILFDALKNSWPRIFFQKKPQKTKNPLRDHPFKTSACLGGGVSPCANGQKVPIISILLECRWGQKS